MIKKRFGLLFSITILSSTGLAVAGDKAAETSVLKRGPQAADDPLSPSTVCLAQIEQVLNDLHVLRNWRRHAPSRSGDVYRSPTSEFGKWVELVVTPQSSVIQVLAADKTTQYSFDADCKPTSSEGPGFDLSRTRKFEGFSKYTDQDLQKTINSHKQGLVYVWSPQMVYSAKFMKDFETVAKKMNLAFIPIVGPNAVHEDFLKICKHMAIDPPARKLNSVELFARGGMIHFPTTFVFKNGRISDQHITGVEDKESLERDFTRTLGEML